MTDSVVSHHAQIDFQHVVAQSSDFTQDVEFKHHMQDAGIDPNVDPQLATEHQAAADDETGSVQMPDITDVGVDVDVDVEADVEVDEAEVEGDGELDLGSIDGIQEPFSPRRGFTHKRNEEPPRNEAGKMICKFISTCAGVTFDRRCEWSKHMDKHERPYKCPHAGCEKLQGFTYSGGLLRHQREVHKMHGGTKKALYCPEPNCKRNAGSGFTRKENLSEHIRRVHRRTTDGTPIDSSPHTIPTARMQSDSLEQLEAVAREHFDGMNDPALILKRKRDELGLDLTIGEAMAASVAGAEVDTLRDEVKRLKTDVVDRDSRMANLEEQLKIQQQLIQQLINSATAAKVA